MAAADVLQVVSFTRGGRPIVLFDLERINNDIAGDVWKQRNTFNVTPGEVQDVNAQGPRRWSGQRAVGSRSGNGSIGARWTVRGDTPDEAIVNAEAFIEQMRKPLPGRYIRWKPVGVSYSTYYEIRGNGSWKPDYSKIVFEQNYSISVDATWPVAPLAELDRMDIYDDFSIPVDATLLYTNMAHNPRAGLDLTGIGALSSGITITRITSGVPGGFSTGVESTGAVVPGTTNAAATYGSITGAIGQNFSGPVVAGGKYGGRMSQRVVSISVGTITSIQLRIYWYKGDGNGSAITASSTLQSQASPVVGTDYELSGVATAPADAVFGVVRMIVVNGAVSSSWVVRSSAALMTAIDASAVVAPAYFDGEFDRARWAGPSHRSASELYATSVLDEDYSATMPVNGGALKHAQTPGAPSGNPWHTARGYRYADVMATVKVTPTASGGTVNYAACPGIKQTTDGRYFWAGNENAFLKLWYWDGSANIVLGSVAITTASVGLTVWCRVWSEGNMIFADWWATTPPSPMAAPVASIAFQLTELTNPKASDMGAGRVGRVSPRAWAMGAGSTADIEEFDAAPYTYRNRVLPDTFALPAIPGSLSAPALVDLELTPSGPSTTSPVWGLFGWWRKPELYSLVWNGSFEVNMSGWATSGRTGLNAGASQSRVSGGGGSPGAYMQVTTDASATLFQGSGFKVYRKFRKGTTYTITARVWVVSGTWALQATGPSGGDDTSITGLTTASWQDVTLVWTPTADRDWVEINLRRPTSPSVAQQALIDTVSMYEGIVAPTRSTQVSGRGAVPPVGLIQAENADLLAEGFGTWVITTDANYRSGQGLKLTGIAGAASCVAAWTIDPSLLEQDDFTQYELDVEVFARLELSSTLVSPKAVLSAVPLDGVTYGAARYSNEWGSGGQLLTKPSSGTVFRRVRLGTITLYVDPRSPTRWYLKLLITSVVGSTGTIGLDDLELAPVASRAVTGPTGVALDASYPRLANTAGLEITRLFRADGSGFTSPLPRPGLREAGRFPDIGMSRELELPGGGDAEALINVSSLVPSDPTSDASSEVEDINGTVHFAVIPRVHLARSA